MKNWYVITGGPAVGKSTVIQVLEQKGYAVMHEIARKIIDHELVRDGGVLPWKNPQLFQDFLAEVQIGVERGVSYMSDLFLDRGVIDLVAFCEHYHVKKSQILLDYMKDAEYKKYQKVFILDPIPQYKNDEGRVLSEAESLDIHRRIHNLYVSLGFDVVVVPFATPEERVRFILSRV